MRLYTQDQLLRLIKLYNTSDESEKKLLKPYCDQAIFKYFLHKLKLNNQCVDVQSIDAHLERAVMAEEVK
jgi:hypothetical protein